MLRLISRYFALKDPPKAEAVARIGIVALFSYILSVADLPKIVPPSVAFLVGIVGPILALIVPTMLFSIGAMIPSVLFMIILALAACTMLLAAATVSDGLFVAVFSVYTWIMTGLFFGKDYDKTNAFANALISIAGLLALS